MIVAGTLQVDFVASVARMVSDVQAARSAVTTAAGGIENAVNSAKQALEAFGVALSVDYFVDIVRGSIEAQDHLANLSRATNLSVEDLAGLQLAARESGGSLDDIAASVDKLSVNMGKAPDKFRALGVSARDPLQAFEQLSDIFVAIQDPQLKAALGAETLGKGWAGAAPLLAEGSRKIQEMVDQGKLLSGQTGDNAERAKEFHDKLIELDTVSTALKNRFVSDLIPGLTDVAKAMLDAKIQGEGFFGVLGAGLAAAIGGNDSTRNMKAIIDLTEQQVKATDDLLAAQNFLRTNGPTFGGPDKKTIEELKASLDTVNAALKTQIDYRAMLDAADQKKRDAAAADKAAADADAADAARKAKQFIDADKMKALDEKAIRSYTSAMQALQEQDDKTNGKTEYQITLNKLLTGTLHDVVDYDTRHGAVLEKQLLAKANIFDVDVARTRGMVDQAKALDGLLKAEQVQADIVRAAHDADTTTLQDMGFQLELIGKTALEQQKLTAVRQVDLKLTADTIAAAKAADAAFKDADPALAGSVFTDTVKKLNDAAAAQKTAIVQNLNDQNAATRDWATGAAQAFNEYVDNATNAAKAAHDAFSSALGSLTDTLTQFILHGKLSFSSFVTSIKEAFAKLAAQTIVLNIVGNVSGTGGAGSGLISGIGSGIGSSLFGGSGTGIIGNVASALGIGGAGSVLGAGGLSAGLTTGGLGFSTGAGAGLTGLGALSADGLGAGLTTGGLGLAADAGAAGGLTVGAGAAGGLGAGAAAGLAAIPVWGWVALGALALGSMLSGGDNHNADPAGPPSRYTIGLNTRTGVTDPNFGAGSYQFQGSRQDGGTYGNFAYLSDAQNAAVTKQIYQMVQAMQLAGTTAGFTATQFQNLNINASGDAATLQDALTQALGSISTQIATTLIPDIANWQAANEALGTTFVRLMEQSQAINQTFQGLGTSIQAMFGGANGANLIDREQQVVAMLGGPDAFSSKASAFYTAFYTDAEKTALQQTAVNQAFGSLGMTAPTSREAFKNLVLSQDLADPSGQVIYTMLMNIAPAFDAVTTAAMASAQALMDQAAATKQAAIAAANDILFHTLQEKQYYLGLVNNGIIPDTSSFAQVPHFAGGGAHGGGWRVVGESGPELEFTPPSHIYNGAQSGQIMDTSGIEDRLDQIISDQRAHAAAIAKNTGQVARILKRWNQDDSIRVFSDDADPIVTRAAV